MRADTNNARSARSSRRSDTAPLVSLRGITKRFGAVQALTEVDLEIPAGLVTALSGDNGAGKTVLIKTIAGLWEPDEGQIFWEGKPTRIRTPNQAEALGITTIYQDLALCDNLNVVQNMYLGHEPVHHRLLDEAKMERSSRKTLETLSVGSLQSIHQPVGFLSGGQRQSVAVGRAVMAHSKLVTMDEPTAALGVAQTQLVFDLVRSLKAQGVAVIMISHNLNDVFAVADRIAILHLGRLVASGPISEFDPSTVVDYMTTGSSSRTNETEAPSHAESAVAKPHRKLKTAVGV